MTKKIVFETKEKREVIDITDTVNKLVAESGVESGLCNLFIMHTTAALTVGELEDGNGQDLLAAFDAMTPKLKYFHDEDPNHVGAHILSALVGSSLSLPVDESKISLGRWQRIALVELDGPRERNIDVTFVSNA